ncbi:MAG: hypothetical protein IPG50_28665 [Myxococcales bacterium]|nr:hypothetical protein [Myxococcales bacterium]
MTDDLVRALWLVFRAGKAVSCPSDDNAMAVAVDGSMGCYRLVCVACGTATPWFEAKGEGIRVRAQSSPPPIG